MLSADDKIEPGMLKLQSFARPPLAGGNYEVHSRLSISGQGKDQSVPAGTSFTQALPFTVAAPRFAIEPSLVYSVYPSPGSAGAYQNVMPHIIFTRKTLPWERTVDGKRPWMALLLLTQQEIEAHRVEVIEKDIINVTKRESTGNLLTPNITIADWEKQRTDKVKMLQMPFSLFKSIKPLTEELDYLAHTRQVDTGDKENSELNPKGWFSVVIGNRLPVAGVLNTVFLVSVEGHDRNLADAGGAKTDDGKTIRLVLLHQWTFTVQGVTFDQLVTQLVSNIKPLRIEADDLTRGSSTDAEKAIHNASKRAFRYGYVPINHDRRTGSKSVSWYRGPLVPVDTEQPAQYIYSHADQALRYDQASGMYDISYAAAWQLGRLLALQSPDFFTALNNWKSAFRRERPLNIAKEKMENTPGVKIDPGHLSEYISKAESDEVLSHCLIELWNENVTR